MASGGRAFRPDIEGLRGVAILLVVLFHAGVTALAGGFVGVDVFFVLSGFFITGILARELTTNGHVRLTEFWGGRALRLLPALLVVLFSTLALVMWLYAPIDRAPIAGTGRSVALYAGNVEFAAAGVNYFGSGDNPLLHTWSLAVEEQFYLVWPMLFVLVAALSAGALESASESERAVIVRRRLLTGIATAGALSLMASLWMTTVSQSTAFFSMPTRVWEFALGGALALLLPETVEERTGTGTALQVGGVLGLVFAVVLYNAGTPYPGAAALLPALAAVALLVGGQLAPESAVSRTLSNDTLRWLGRMSYAWYLWHWPLVGLGAVLNAQIGVFGALAWSGVALVLAWLTHRFVEQPARENGGVLARIPSHALAPAALGASVVAAVVSHAAMNVARTTASALPQKVFATARNDRMDHGCWASSAANLPMQCDFGDKKSSKVLVLFGDSHAEHWLGGLDRMGRERGWRVVAMVMGGCPVPLMPEIANTRWNECNRVLEARLTQIVAMRPSAVLLSNSDEYLGRGGASSRWGIRPDLWQRGLRRTYERLTKAGIRTVVMRDTPQTDFDVPSCLSRRAANLPFARECGYGRTGSISPDGIEAQDGAARGLPIRFVKMNDVVCPPAPGLCPVMQKGIVVYTDDDHLTRTFSRSVAPVLGARIEQALRD